MADGDGSGGRARHGERWRRPVSLRGRTVLAATAVFAVALAAGSVAFVSQLRAAQVRAVDRALTLEVSTVAALVRSGAPPNPLPVGPETSFVQVVGPAGRVLSASATLDGQDVVGAVAPAASGAGVSFRTAADLPVGDGGTYRLAVAGAASPAGPVTIEAGESLQPVDRAVHQTALGLAVADPLLLVLLAAGLWVVARRTLAPVERIRREVADISAGDLHRRVDEPGTGDEISLLAATMNGMLSRLDAAAQRQRAFVADASHELRSPLAAAHAALDVALEHDPGDGWPAVARTARADIDRVRRIVDDLLVLVPYDAGVPPRRSAVDLDETVLGEVASLRHLSPVTLDATGVSGARVLGDPEQLRRMVRNLLDNAVRHAEQRVTVSLSADGGDAVLVVADDGPGIPAAERQRVFERFTRTDAGRDRAHGGTGLGLAIVREVVTAQDGRIDITDAHPGARFTVHLPAEPDGTT